MGWLTLKENIKNILREVENKNISAEEAYRLLDNEINNTNDYQDKKLFKSKAKWIRIKIKSDEQKINLKLPFWLMGMGLKIGCKYSKDLKDIKKDFDLKEIINILRKSPIEKLVDINTLDGEKVEISLE